MASVFEKAPGRWWCKFKDRQGRWRAVPTGERTKRAAMEFALEKQRVERRVQEGFEPDRGAGADKSVGWLIDWWLESEAPKLKSRSFEIYLRKYALPVVGEVPLKQIAKHHVQELLAGIEDEHGLDPKTVNDIRAALHRVFVLGAERGK